MASATAWPAAAGAIRRQTKPSPERRDEPTRWTQPSILPQRPAFSPRQAAQARQSDALATEWLPPFPARAFPAADAIPFGLVASRRIGETALQLAHPT